MSQVMNPVWGSVGDLFLYPDAHAEDDMRMSADLVAAAFSDRLGRAGRDRALSLYDEKVVIARQLDRLGLNAAAAVSN